MSYSITYAQNREDLIVAGFLKAVKNGFYVDVGAHDPDYFSVTKRLYMSGWHGINIEPSLRLFDKLKLKRARDINLMVGVGSSNKMEVFREYPKADGLSTFSGVLKRTYEQGGYEPTSVYVDTEMPVRTLRSIFEEFSVDHVDFLKIDVEGYEYEVIVGNDWEKYRPTLLCVEAKDVDKDWRPLLLSQDYSLVFFDGLNEYYLSKESENLAKDFVYNESVLNQNYISLEEYKVLRDHKDEIRKLNYEKFIISQSLAASHEYAVNLEQQISATRQRLGELEYHVWQSRRLKKSLKIFIRALDATVRANIIRLENRFLKRKIKIQPMHESAILLSGNKNKLLSSIRAYDFDANLNKSRLEQEQHAERQYLVDIENIYLKITRGVFHSIIWRRK